MQWDLNFGYTKTGRNCPETSYEAAHKMDAVVLNVRESVYRFIEGQGEKGATAHEVHIYFEADKNTTSPRITELKDAGMVYKTSMRRKNAKGNSSVVWRSTSV